MLQQIERMSVKAGFVLLALLAFAIGNFWLLIADRSDREILLAAELGSLGRIDEGLTMSALMAAASDDSYERRYRKLLDKREGVIERIQELSESDEMRAMVEAVDRAQRAMIAVELKSFDLNAAGKRDTAYQLLTELEYRRDLSNYENALTLVGERVRRKTAQATEQAESWLIASGLMLALLGAAMVLREFRMRAQLAKEAVYAAGRRAHRTVMQTVMDAHNNFLNNMLYFRIKAEAPGGLDAEDLALMDKTLEEAREKIQLIAELDEAVARGEDVRDLGGGIAVLSGAAATSKTATDAPADDDFPDQTPPGPTASGGSASATTQADGPNADGPADVKVDADAPPAPAPAGAAGDDAGSGSTADGDQSAKAAAAANSARVVDDLEPQPASRKLGRAAAKPRDPTPLLSARAGKKSSSDDAFQPS